MSLRHKSNEDNKKSCIVQISHYHPCTRAVCHPEESTSNNTGRTVGLERDLIRDVVGSRIRIRHHLTTKGSERLL
eukprot:5961421-Amphidinium_carterae.1